MAKCVVPVVIDSVTITSEETKKLQEAWLGLKASEDLIKKGVSNDAVLDRHTEKYSEYSSTFESILDKYFDGKYKVGNFNWNCDFYTYLVTITQ